jgi:hypothetical protein
VSRLLDPLTPEQQKLVDLVAGAFYDDSEWPIFDYVEGTFDQEKLDATETLASLPSVGRWGYGAVWWIGKGQVPPTREIELELTLVGMHHSRVLQPVVAVFFDLIELMVAKRRGTRLSRRKPRKLSVTNEDVKFLLASERRLSTPMWDPLLFNLMMREPSIFATGVDKTPDGQWTKAIPREVDAYQGVTTIDDYVARLEHLTALPDVPMMPAAPSPLDLVSALDYLDVVWRLAHRRPLFSYPSAERTAKLAYPANTQDELASRLSGLAEILRSANASAKAAAGAKHLPASSHEHPLARLEGYLVGKVDSASEARVRLAVATLERAIAIRDAAQHAEAGERAVRALTAFGIGYPVIDFAGAWAAVTSGVVEALGAIREELAADAT